MRMKGSAAHECLQKLEEDMESPGAAVTGSC